MQIGDRDMRDSDRLPWLETVEQERDGAAPVIRIVMMVVGLLALVAVAILGYRYWDTHRGINGDGALIAAPAGARDSDDKCPAAARRIRLCLRFGTCLG